MNVFPVITSWHLSIAHGIYMHSFKLYYYYDCITLCKCTYELYGNNNFLISGYTQVLSYVPPCIAEFSSTNTLECRTLTRDPNVEPSP